MCPCVEDSGAIGARKLFVLGVTGVDVDFESAIVFVALVAGFTAEASFFRVTHLVRPQIRNGVEA